MDKRFWLVTVLVFGLGIVVGVFGHMYWGTIQPGANQPTEKENATKVDGRELTPSENILIDSSVTGHDAGIGSIIQQNKEEGKPITLSQTEQDKLISDYKQALGILFDAWKAKDMPTFRSILANAYYGDILESHIRKAEKYLPRGIGLYVSEINFDDIDIESADKHSATINAIYRYTVQDYDLDEEYPYGEKHSHFVHVRADLIKIDSRWLITGETVI
ncbi:MAG TPA: hypothetical protein GXX46_00705 [Peptococcaceae bacterium]|nr:hypothetical protein [Peptococcaceae bacterium]